ncbi:unnamed protein product [Rotaria sp. Silwood1]|nr:unnamed protein product [Rotaria sp. Silwood1]CAF1597992.1 unnamed protein product [Rotaria sp. Silwood1]CAF3695702.1 unnamed protein product [Rotaria sp. Silwood1]CAF4730536.1 unnamed protein product [Rotaria sp. Silwood1]
MVDSSIVLNNTNPMNKNYRRPLYLTQSSYKLFQIISKRLNYSLKKKDEQEFIYKRLSLFDQQYYLENEQHLWQSYFDIGLQQHVWPEELFKMANTTNDTKLCHDFLMTYVENLKEQLNKCQLHLNEQSPLCSITKFTLDQIDQCLKEYVHSERNYLSKRQKDQLIKFKDYIHEKDLYKTITSYQFNINLNEYSNKLTTIREQQAAIWKDYLMLEMRIQCKILPKHFDYLENFLGCINYLPFNDTQNRIEIKNKRFKLIQEAKRTWLFIFFSVYIHKLVKREQLYENEFKQLEIQLLNNKTTKDGVCFLSNMREYITYRTNRLKQDTTYEISSFRGILINNRQRSSTAKNMIGVSPETFLHLLENPFITLQWNQLSLGPSYIRLNQSGIRPEKQQQKLLEKEHKKINDIIKSNLTKMQHIPEKSSVLKDYSTNLLNYLHHSYLTPLSYKDKLAAQQQQYIASSIRKVIREKNLIIRVTDKGHNFYIGSAIEFEKKAQKFFSDTNAFIELSENPFNDIVNKVIQLLNRLRGKDLIRKWQYDKMMPNRAKCELAHLYFNPKTHKENIPVRPIENTIHAPTTNISKFLDKILQPIFNDKCKETNIVDGASLIEGLHKYKEKGLLKSSTLFCTFDIHNLYTMLPQEESIRILGEFLEIHGYTKVKAIDIDTIKQLASIVLQENAFVYDKKIYKQTTGGAMGSSFTLTLANIFMWKWQKEFVRQQDITNEFYGRYIDDVFMTWNRSEKELRKLLEDANKWHPNIKLDFKISQSLPFLDVLLTNDNGILSTSVYHKPAAEPYVTPYLSDHPRHVFQNIIQNALTKAVRYSSTYQLFLNEQILIRYPSSFIDKQFFKFFNKYKISTTPFLSMCTDEKQFKQMRQIILRIPTYKQSQVALSAATANLDNDPSDEPLMQETNIINDPEKNDAKLDNKIIIHYTHEKRLHSFKRDMHRIMDHTFENKLDKDIKLIVGNRNRRAAENELIRKRPKQSLLKNRIPKKLSSNPFEITLNKVVRLLNDLHVKQHKITAWQYKQMWPNLKTCKLAYMYFNPKTHKDGTPFRPIMNTIDSPTTNISRLLDQLIRPIFNQKVSHTTIVDGWHLIKRLRQYVNDGHLKSTTLFCTFDINNLYTMLPQQQSLDILVEFFQTFQISNIHSIDHQTIRELARIVIEENVFVYRNKYYQQIIGGAMGSPFTLTLANIFMWKWEKESICKMLPSTEIYGRYIDDIFITWNDSQEKLEALLKKLNSYHPNIKLEYKIGTSLPFLDVTVSNNNGNLSTSVYHKPAAEPYVVPFTSDHPRHIFRNIIRAAKIRAIRYSSTFEAFNTERRNIRFMLLYNGYPTRYIDKEFRKFFGST